MSKKIDSLEKLAQLKEKGIISQKEFEAEKKKLLADDATTIQKNDKEGKKKTNPILAGLGILVIIIIALNMIGTANRNLNTSHGTSTQVSDLQVLEDRWCYGEYGSKSVCGMIVNNSNRLKSYAQVEVNLYDSNGNQIGSALDNINNLEPHGKWKFNAFVLEDAAASYKIKDISSF